MHRVLLNKLAVLLSLIWFAGCLSGETIGTLTGTTTADNGRTVVFEINFIDLDPSRIDEQSFSLSLNNPSGDRFTFILREKNASATSLNEEFPAGTYSFTDGSLFSAEGQVVTSGTTREAISATTGTLTIRTINFDEQGVLAVIDATYDLWGAGNDHFYGGFTRDLSASD